MLEKKYLEGMVVVKRDGRQEYFDSTKITRAIDAALNSGITELYNANAQEITLSVVRAIQTAYYERDRYYIGVEQIQDIVEFMLGFAGEHDALNRFMAYRAKHASVRKPRPVPAEVKELYDASAKYFKTPLQQFQYFDKYSKFNRDENRRETWAETARRATEQLRRLANGKLEDAVFDRIYEAIVNMRVMPSMRLLAMAGESAERNQIGLYNCSYQAVRDIKSFVEALIISMAGCGVGFSVEKKYVEQLPEIAHQQGFTAPELVADGLLKSLDNRGYRWDFEQQVYHAIGETYVTLDNTLVVGDSAEGWASAMYLVLQTYWLGGYVNVDYSKIRPAGTPLKVKGGRASGPGPFKTMLEEIVRLITKRQGGKLSTLDAHDMMCHVGSAAVAGGVRRTAMISLFDYDDQLMLTAKSANNFHFADVKWGGSFTEDLNTQRANANNSAVWPEDRELAQMDLINQMTQMFQSGNGEPGIFNRAATRTLSPERRDTSYDFGTNPCGEIILRDMQFCNLSAAIARADDTFGSLADKVEVAAIIGTIQSMAVDFKLLRPEWSRNCAEERLLGVDITGQMDCPAVQNSDTLMRLQERAVMVNEKYADLLGIPHSAAVTCVKPSGNTSVMLDCSPGLHARWSRYYTRNVRVGHQSPLWYVLKDAGVPMEVENGQDANNPKTWVASFPTKSPAKAIVKTGRSAIRQCEYWLLNKRFYTEHNPSVTITYRPGEELDLIRWVWEHRDQIGGMSFLPAFDIKLPQLPYIELSEEEYQAAMENFPSPDKFNWSLIYGVEYQGDETKATSELACISGACETL